MPNAFAITAASESVSLNEQGKGEIAFTVSNTSGRPLRVRVKTAAQTPARDPWLSLQGEGERDLRAEETQQIVAKVETPAGTAPGSYSFRLNVIAVENPDELYGESPSVAFVIAKQEEPQPVKFPYWIIPIAAVVLIGIVVGVILLALPKDAAVPKFVDLKFPQAEALAEENHLKLAKESSVISEKEADTVLTQSKPERESVERGTVISVTVAALSVAVPDVRTKPLGEAKKLLGDAKLVAGESKSVLTGAPKETVVDQDPKPGTRVAPDTVVQLVVEGDSVKVPKVQGLEWNAALAALTKSGLFARAEERASGRGAAPGTVFDQKPGPDQVVARGSEVHVLVEPQKINMPELRAMPYATALQALQANGLVLGGVEYRLARNSNNVVDQNPKPGVQVSRGQKVTLVVDGIRIHVIKAAELEKVSPALREAIMKPAMRAQPGVPK